MRGFCECVMKQPIGIAPLGVSRGVIRDGAAHGFDVFGRGAQGGPAGNPHLHEFAHFEQLSDRGLGRECRQIGARDMQRLGAGNDRAARRARNQAAHGQRFERFANGGPTDAE